MFIFFSHIIQILIFFTNFCANLFFKARIFFFFFINYNCVIA